MCSSDLLRDSNHSMLDIQLNRLGMYLILIINRHNKTKLSIGSMYVNTLKSFDLFDLSQKIINKIEELTGEVFGIEEVLGLELLLLIWNDIPHDIDMQHLYPMFYEEALMLTDKIFNIINEEDSIDFSSIENSQNKLVACLITIMCKIFFKSSNYIFTGRQVYENPIRTSPLSCYFAEKTRELIDEFYQCKLSDHDVNMIAVNFYSLIDCIDYDYNKRRVLVVARNGFEGARIIRNKILKRFNNRWFDKIDICEFYEGRRYKKADYDYVVLNYGQYSYYYDWPYVLMSQIPSEDEMTNLYNNVILSGFNLKVLCDIAGISRINIYDDFQYFSKDSFIQLLCFKLYLNKEDALTLTRTLSQISDLHISNEILTVFIPKYYIKSNLFEIYKLEKKTNWMYKKLSYIVVVGVDFDHNLKLLHFVERATSILMASSSAIEEIVESNENDCFERMLLKNIKAG